MSSRHRISIRLFSGLTLAPCLLMMGAGASWADETARINCGKPQKGDIPAAGVVDTYTVAIDGVEKKVTIRVYANEDPVEKAEDLTKAINKAFAGNPAEQEKDEHGSSKPHVRIKGDRVGCRLSENQSSEGFGIEYLSFLPPHHPFPYDATFTVDGAIAGTDLNGAESVFTASFGYDGLTDPFSSTFSGLSAPTADGLLSDMYSHFLAGLPPDLRSDLVFDPRHQEIGFHFPQGQQRYFVNFESTDRMLMYGAGTQQQSVPEPASPLLLGVCELTALVCFRRYRKRARNATRRLHFAN